MDLTHKNLSNNSTNHCKSHGHSHNRYDPPEELRQMVWTQKQRIATTLTLDCTLRCVNLTLRTWQRYTTVTIVSFVFGGFKSDHDRPSHTMRWSLGHHRSSRRSWTHRICMDLLSKTLQPLVNLDAWLKHLGFLLCTIPFWTSSKTWQKNAKNTNTLSNCLDNLDNLRYSSTCSICFKGRWRWEELLDLSHLDRVAALWLRTWTWVNNAEHVGSCWWEFRDVGWRCVDLCISGNFNGPQIAGWMRETKTWRTLLKGSHAEIQPESDLGPILPVDPILAGVQRGLGKT